MILDAGLSTGGSGRFHTTRWSVVLGSAQSQALGYKEAFAELCRLCWYPLYAFVRRRGCSPHDAQDLTQGFFLHLLEHKTLIHRLRKHYTGLVREEIVRTVSSSADVDAEIHDLCEALIAAEGRVMP